MERLEKLLENVGFQYATLEFEKYDGYGVISVSYENLPLDRIMVYSQDKNIVEFEVLMDTTKKVSKMLRKHYIEI